VSHSIAFTRFVDRGLPVIGGTTWLVDPDGKNLRQLAGVSSTDTNPVWSPNGTRIAFSGREAGKAQIYVIGSDGYDLVRLTCATDDFQATWSPDGTRLLFVREDHPGVPDTIYAMNADGTGVTLVFHPETDWFYNVAWSPDGQWIAAMRTDRQVGSIWLFKPDGTQLHRLTQPDNMFDSDPSWSPDGHWIAFDQFDGLSGPSSIWVVKPDGSALHQLIRGSFSTPAWSPDGSRLAFFGGTDKRWAIYTATAAGAGLRMVAGPFSEVLQSLSWSPAR
jgi:TolB protein